MQELKVERNRMDELDDLIEGMNFKIINDTLKDSYNLTERIKEYDDMPYSKVLEDSIISSSKELSPKLLSSRLLLKLIQNGD
tara:strand:- start:99 stop:344 length:246 start_codon:yes stop_codon:yes gene_type:complete